MTPSTSQICQDWIGPLHIQQLVRISASFSQRTNVEEENPQVTRGFTLYKEQKGLRISSQTQLRYCHQQPQPRSELYTNFSSRTHSHFTRV